MAGFWESCLLRFEQELPEQQFNTWIKPLRLEGEQVALEEGLRLIAPNGFILKWVRDRYLSRIEEYSHSFFSAPVAISLVIGSAKAAPIRSDSAVEKLPESSSKPISAKPMIWPGLLQFRSPTTQAPPTTLCSSTAVPALARRT